MTPSREAALGPNPSGGGFPRFSRGQLVLILGLTVLAAALRFYRLGEWSFWIDEAHTYRDATSHIDEFWSGRVSRYPLSFLTLRALLEFLPGTSEGWLRLPFAFFGIVTIPALALVGRALVGPRAALVAAALLAVFPWHIYWSQSARGYTMTLFFGLVGSGCFHHGLVRRQILLIALGLGCLALSAFSHLSGILLATAWAAYVGVFAVRHNRVRRWANPYTLAGAALVGGGAFVLVWPSLAFASEAKPDPSVTHFVTTLGYFASPTILAAALGGWLVLARDAKTRDGSDFLGCWVVAPCAILTAVGAILTKVTAQYAFTTLPALCLGTGALLVWAAGRIDGARLRDRALAAAIGGVVFLPLLSYDFLYYTAQQGDRPRWRDGTLYVRSQPGDKLVLTTNDRGLEYYLCRRKFRGEPCPGVEVVSLESWEFRKAGGPVPYIENAITDASAEGRSVWVVTTEPELTEKDPSREFERWLRREARQLKRYPTWTGPKDMTVLVWELPKVLPPR